MSVVKSDDNPIKPASEVYQIGDTFKVPRSKRVANKSPYQVITGFDGNDPSIIYLTPLDAPGNGNRKQRRANFRATVKANAKK